MATQKKATKIYPAKTAVLAELFDVHPRTVRNWATKGMPQISHGNFDLLAVFTWYMAKNKLAQDNTPSAEMAESQKIYWEAKATRESIKAQTDQHKVIAFVDIETDCFNAGRQIKENLKSLVEQIAPELAAESELFEIKKIMKENINRVLTDLSNDFTELQLKHKMED